MFLSTGVEGGGGVGGGFMGNPLKPQRAHRDIGSHESGPHSGAGENDTQARVTPRNSVPIGCEGEKIGSNGGGGGEG